jgi:hypothetical protein
VDRAAGHMSPVAVDILVPTLRRVNWTKLTHLAPVRRFEHPTPADDMPFVHNVLAPARGHWRSPVSGSAGSGTP